MKKTYLLSLLYCFCSFGLFGQDGQPLILTLEKAIEIAQQQSPDAIAARHSFRSQYWNYCYYKANYLPSLTFTSMPNFNHSINAITLPDGTSSYVQQNQLITDGNLTLNQNIALTGGSLFLKSGLQRLDVFDTNYTSYKTVPVVIGYEQRLLGYNNLKWDKKIEPVRFEEAKKTYVEMLEFVAQRVTSRFFSLAMAQTNLQIARFNYANADTLYIFAKGRYNIGTITENEMLQLEINRLTEESNLLNTQIEVDDCIHNLRAYLGMNDQESITAQIEESVPELVVNLNEALQLAMTHNPDILTMKRRLLESESLVAQAKASRGFDLNVFAQLGLTQTNENFSMAYKDPLNQQYVELGIRVPILDWGRGKGKVKVAKSNRDMVQTQVDQERTNFEQNILKLVKQFNIQSGKINIAAKTDRTAERRGEVARRLYILGKSTILDLNSSVVEKDAAKRGYINALYNYWILYYSLRSITLYDFEKGISLTEDYEKLIK